MTTLSLIALAKFIMAWGFIFMVVRHFINNNKKS